MRILADVRLLSRGGLSGIEEYTRNLLRSVLENDKKNSYRYFYNGLRKQPLDLPEREIVDGRVPNKLLDLSARFTGFPTIEKFSEADLVFSPHFNYLRSAKTPRVITFHDLSFLRHPYFFSVRQRLWHWLQDVRGQAASASRIIAVSEFTKSDLVNLLGVPPEKIDVVYSGISPDLKKLEIGGREEARPYILYLGTLEPRKNVPGIIRAFNLLKQDPAFRDWQLVIAGKEGWLYSNILKEASASPYKDDILIRGAVSGQERVLLYNLAKVFVYPSFLEGFGFPPLEAQACGCPVVVSDRTSLPEVVGESALFVDPWRVGEIAEAIREAALNRKTRERLIRGGYANIRRFDWGEAAKKTIKVFDHAVQ